MCSIIPTCDKNTPKNLTSKHEKFLSHAARIAQKSTMEHKHGAVIVLDNQIIACGFNHVEEFMCHNYSIHAEVDAILKAKKKSKKQKYDLTDADMYVVRIGSIRMDYPLKYSRPCPDCEKAISKHGLRRVYYSTNKEFYECCSTITCKKN